MFIAKKRILLDLQDEKKQSETSEDEGMGKSDIKYGDTIVFIQHCDTGLWLSYQTTEVKKKGVGKVEEKKVSFRTPYLPNTCIWLAETLTDTY